MKTEETLELEVPMLLPGVGDDRDACIERLEEAMGSRKGILRAHLELEKSPVVLCLHYDPMAVSVEDLQRMAGRAGTDVALETADVALMADDLSRLPFSVGLGRATRGIIRQNLAISFGVIAVLIVLALSGLAGIGVAIVFHEGSTLVVVLNALRLLAYREWSLQERILR